MNKIKIIQRAMSSAEYEQIQAGFESYARENRVEVQQSERIGLVAMDGDIFVGSATGLAYKNRDAYSGWFYLTDLFVEKAYRSQGLGARLLGDLEEVLRQQKITKIWTWTAGYEAPGFYKKQGYATFAEMEAWYSDGSSRVGLRKGL